jgi:hypothetical protein
MPLLAKKTRGRAWVPLGGELPDDMAFPARVVSDLYDARGGTSFWVVSERNGDDVRRLVANMACMFKTLDTQEIRFIDNEDLTSIGIAVNTKKPGELLDKGFGANHRELQVTTIREAVELTKQMLHIEPVTMTSERVVACVAEAIEREYLEISRLHKDFLQALAKAGAIRMKDSGLPAGGLDSKG